MIRHTLEQHLQLLKQQELTGDDILRPFPGRADFDGAEDQPCQVTAVLTRTAVVCTEDSAEKHVVNVRLVTIDPADVKLSASRQASRASQERAAAARGRRASRIHPFGRAGKGVRDGG